MSDQPHERPAVSDQRSEGATATALRRLILALIFLSAGAMLVDLLLLEHFETAWQWAPLALLVPVLAIVAVVAFRPSRASVRLLQGAMLACIAAGLLGMFLHYRGNLEFELERDASLRGIALFWETIRGATPALAPGAMVQLGLLGLAFAFRHPALSTFTTRAASGAAPNPTETS